MPSPLNIAVFGSAFNPPTLGHLSVLGELVHFDKVLLVPSFKHAWGKKMADFALRCHWLAQFIQDAKTQDATFAALELCTLEQQISDGNAVTTWDLLTALQTHYPTSKLTFVMGPDNLLQFNQFYRAADIAAKWNILSCPERVAIRSTMIREALTKGASIDKWTTKSVARSIHADDFI